MSSGQLRQRAEPLFHKLRYCVWELTLACNLRCGHCGSRAGRPRPDELDTAECFDLVRSLARLGCQVITLSGGEPTLRRDWYAIASEIRERGMIPNLVTNGVIVDDAMARQMRQAGLANVAVSIEGPPDVHDRIRGQGSFDLAARAVRALRSAGLPATVMTTINALNLRRLEETHDIAVALGAERWRSQLGKPMGSMADHGGLTIEPGDLLTLLPALYELYLREQIEVSIGDSIGYCGPFDCQLRATSWDGRPQRWGGCQAGLQAIGIEADGGIKGCLSLQAFGGAGDPFLEGNVRSRSLESIWIDPDSFAYNRHFEAASLTGFCRKCRHRLQCRGGARCMAAAVTGGLAEDPFCYFRVSALAARRPSSVLRQQIAAAASVFSLLGSGCGALESAQLAAGAKIAAEIQCDEVCCDCGEALSPEVEAACCVEPTSRYGVAAPEEGNPPPSDDVDCADCDYGIAPEYGIAIQEVCLPIDQACAGFDCEASCLATMCDYGDLPPATPVECDVCCVSPVENASLYAVSEPTYGIEAPVNGWLEVARFDHSLNRQESTVVESWQERPSADGVAYPRDISLVAAGGDPWLTFQSLGSHDHEASCGYFSHHGGGICLPDSGTCSGLAPVSLAIGPLFSMVNATIQVAPIALDVLGRLAAPAPTPLLAVASWSEVFQLEELLGVCLARDRVSIVQRDPGSGRLTSLSLGLFAPGDIGWIHAAALAEAPALLLMRSGGELELHLVQGDRVSRSAVPAPVAAPLDARAFVAGTGAPVLATAPLAGGFVAVGITRSDLQGAADQAVDPRAPAPEIATFNRLAFFTVGCGTAIAPRR
ncbi:MAG: radical SAM protein [Deltaproteobacteria bacterium]|nr:radical SAM protein [Deltaproteobacteria bacterium]